MKFHRLIMLSRMLNFKLALCFAILNLLTISSSAESPKVRTPKGVLKGKYLLSRNGRQYEAYIGIRFGVVPERFEVN